MSASHVARPRNSAGKGIPYEKQLSLFGDLSDPRQVKAMLQAKLEAEGETELAAKLAGCGQVFRVWCRECGHCHEGNTRCSRKWCPLCARLVAARRSAKLEAVARSFRWPLFVTLTCRNIPSAEASRDFVRWLRKCFGKLRHRKIWTARVKGGAAAIEVTNTGAGWHPHIHALIDCEWLAVKTPKPRASDSSDRIGYLCESAAREFGHTWGKILQQDVPPSVKVKRCSHEAAKEVMKYAIKGSDLAESPDPIGPVLRMMDGTRLVTTFGSAFGIDAPEMEKPPFVCPAGHSAWTMQPPLSRREAVEAAMTAREKLALQRAAEFETSIARILEEEAARVVLPPSWLP